MILNSTCCCLVCCVSAQISHRDNYARGYHRSRHNRKQKWREHDIEEASHDWLRLAVLSGLLAFLRGTESVEGWHEERGGWSVKSLCGRERGTHDALDDNVRVAVDIQVKAHP